ncbi:hypothetical protein, partial [Collinsella sp. An268]|uniref:hypothetical protein n=1 Tax=Collinsella sp. An268 TaxID=1965612 RepID=UPI0019D050AE
GGGHEGVASADLGDAVVDIGTGHCEPYLSRVRDAPRGSDGEWLFCVNDYNGPCGHGMAAV